MRSGNDAQKEGRREMKKRLTMATVLLAPLMLLAGPAAKIDPVAEGYPDWQGITPKGYVAGREITPSELRHKVTIVIEIELNEKLTEQLVLASKIASRGVVPAPNFATVWETYEVPRDVVTVFSVRGGGGAKMRATIAEILGAKKIADKDAAAAVRRMDGPMGCAFYEDVTFTGAPDNGGKTPFLYVMGPTGREPLFKGELNAAAVSSGLEAVAKGKKEIAAWEPKWRPFYGNVGEPKFNTSLAKALEKGKTAKTAPLAAVSKALLSDVKSKDAARAKEAQTLYDAIEQTRGDLVVRIHQEVSACPYLACRDVERLLKYWPTEKKRIEATLAKLRANPEIEALGKICVKVEEWSDPAFVCKNAGEAKKIIQELTKMKKVLDKAKESKVTAVQNGAASLGMKVEDLIASMPSRIPSK